MINEYGYESGLLSNSMVQASQFCTRQFRERYVLGKVVEGGRTVVEATTMGSLVHKSLEAMPLRESVLEVFFQEAAGFLGVDRDYIRSLVIQTYTAYDAVGVYGKRYGKVYTAPHMTSYWKQNFGHIDALWTAFQRDLEGGFEFRISALEFLSTAYSCIQNELNAPAFVEGDWDKAARELKVGGEFEGVPMIGTIDILLVGGDEVRMIDYKTGFKKWTVGDVVSSDQFCLYTHLLSQNGILANKQFTLGVRDLRNNTLVLASPCDAEMAKWKVRYSQKVKMASSILNTPTWPDVVIPAGSGFSPGCPCPYAPGCPYV